MVNVDIIYRLVQVTSFVLMLWLVLIIRKKTVKESYALMWLSLLFVVLVLSSSHKLRNSLSSLLGNVYPSSIFFLIAFGFFSILCLYFTFELTKQKEINLVLTQELGLLRERLCMLEKHLNKLERRTT